MSYACNWFPPASAQDPANAYMTHDDEACARVEIVLPAYNTEPEETLELRKNEQWNQVAIECNAECYDLLHKMLGDTRYWAHVDNQMSRDRDGRAAFLSIRRNVCGPTANSDLNRSNRARADAAYWDGEKRNRNWMSFINLLRRCRRVQQGLAAAEKDKYHAFTEDDMVTFLRRGCKNPLAKVGLSTVMATKHLRENFEDAQVHVWQMIQQEMDMAKVPTSRTVAEANTNCDTNRGKQPWTLADGKYDQDGIREGKYDKHLDKFKSKKGTYSKSEWEQLHPMIKRKRYLERRTKDGSLKRGFSPGRKGGAGKRTVAALEAELAEAKRINKGLQDKIVGRPDNDDEEALEVDQRSNSNNEALVPYGGTRNHFKK